ncbi:cysteine desulfurase family protein [Nocardioides sp. Kera G14]|uniref:cysteine desulfurase family protein n=1 Tax=Nocardioides sp. Kera G14 TaxID=2884264 RepID=UPI001D11D5BE|nr:aminotransferase class V-fold PLP-dependent enzyme [Nocardioides sp. Kera G14]UDY22550.1 aminotransferase class V-fold PLP-dependent enzyme [Nocardioides sp. Kera G14]
MAPPPVYLDSASSEPLHPAARDVLMAAYERGYADPRRLHGPGRDARLLLDNAREAVAESLGVRRDEVTFTASGTGAVHRGLLGLARARERRAGRQIVHTAVEHQSVFHAAHWWGDPSVVAVDHVGRVDPARVGRRAAEAAVVGVQTANHEVGTLQPIAEVRAAVDPSVPFFVDACASMGRLPLPRGWDAAAGSAHKWGGPPGVGILLVRRGVAWESPFPGDDRIDERGSGFENVPAALAAAAALQAVVAEREETNAQQSALIDLVRSRVGQIDGVEVLGDPVDRLPHLVTFAFERLDGEAVVTALDKEGFGVASGSACAASTLEPSSVLSALGALDALTHGNLRLSLTRETTRADVERLLDALPRVVADLRAGPAAQ